MQGHAELQGSHGHEWKLTTMPSLAMQMSRLGLMGPTEGIRNVSELVAHKP